MAADNCYRGYGPTLSWEERLYHRDNLRAARYAALADAEGFQEVCFALEQLGFRLLQKKAQLGKYKGKLYELSLDSTSLSDLSGRFPGLFFGFSSLFERVRVARNDAMHTGVYARHVTQAAIELCIGLEEALMKEQQYLRNLVQDFMVKDAVTVESWQPVAHARQLMLTHSFSFLPVFIDVWKLVSEGALARYIRSGGNQAELLSASLSHAASSGLALINARVVELADNVHDLLRDTGADGSKLWLVQDENRRLCGVLSPFELM